MSCIHIDLFTLSCNQNELLQVTRMSLVKIIYFSIKKTKMILKGSICMFITTLIVIL